MSCRSPVEHEKNVDNVLDWLRSGKDDQLDTICDFEKIDQLRPEKKGQKPKDQSREIEGVMDWLRNKDMSPGDVADSPDDFDELLSILTA